MSILFDGCNLHWREPQKTISKFVKSLVAHFFCELFSLGLDIFDSAGL
jgi:hypothetical protein